MSVFQEVHIISLIRFTARYHRIGQFFLGKRSYCLALHFSMVRIAAAAVRLANRENRSSSCSNGQVRADRISPSPYLPSRLPAPRPATVATTADDVLLHRARRSLDSRDRNFFLLSPRVLVPTAVRRPVVLV